MRRRERLLGAMLLALPFGGAGCGGRPGPNARPTPVSQVAETASSAEVDSLWARSQRLVRHGKWGEAVKQLDRILLEFPPGDPRAPQAHFWLGEAQAGLGSQLQAAREFRKVSDDTPNDPLAPEALLRVGDVYADLWRRPELDPSYGQTALATYQELLNRYPGGSAAARAQQRIAALQEQFAYKQYKAALYYFRLKAYDSAILYLKDLVATYPKTSVAPQALVKLVQAYKTLGYREDVQETCGYLHRFHPNAPGSREVCPNESANAS
jgi:outer membrane protein assembly factor BamD